MLIFAGILAYIGIILLTGDALGFTNAKSGVDQGGRPRGRRSARIGFALIALAVLLSALDARAQVQMWPGQEIQYCNGVGAISGGGIVCFHDITEQRIEMTFKSQMWHATFWGDGTATALLPPLCRISNVHRVTETVFEPGLVRVRTIPCATGKSSKWIVFRVSKP